MAEWSEEELDKVVDDVMRRSMVDPEFRALAIRDSAKAIEKLNTLPLPKEFAPRFVESTAGTPTFILPAPIANNGELTDLELEAVAGGDWCVCTNCCVSSCVFTNCSLSA